MHLALFQPEIAANVGAAMRVAACFGAGLDIIGPCGFPLSDKALRRTAMDYQLIAKPSLHDSWRAFTAQPRGRLVLMTTKADSAHTDLAFRADDTILIGRESSGVPDAVRACADCAVRIAMAPEARSLNMAVAAAVALAEARRQIGWPAAN
ncbi:MAG: TrmH family RNA methyltransferase [Pseudomonadota bacterium]